MTPADLERLAEACERAARDCCVLCFDCDGLDPSGESRRYLCAQCKERTTAADVVFAHARAIRAGRVTVKEEGN